MGLQKSKGKAVKVPVTETGWIAWQEQPERDWNLIGYPPAR